MLAWGRCHGVHCFIGEDESGSISLWSDTKSRSYFEKGGAQRMRKSVLRGFTNLRNRFRFADYGRDVYIHPKAVISRPEYVAIGDGCRISAYASLYTHPLEKGQRDPLLILGKGVFVGIRSIISAHYRVVLKDDVLLGPNVLIADAHHRYEDVTVPIRKAGMTEKSFVVIEEEAWIGMNSCVFRGVTVGRHAVVGANSVVNADVPPYSVVVGIPARVVKRFDHQLGQWVDCGDGSWGTEVA
jgi:acetyltransferase-like isoleucine patch superfamily enzyme